MKINFLGAEKLIDAIELVKGDLGITVCECGMPVEVSEVEEAKLYVKLADGKAEIVYGGGKVRFLRALAALVGFIKDGKAEAELSEKPLFKSNGAMVDMSRNAVMNLDTVKFMLRKMALMGMNTYMLYTEDTYEIESEPYFGYMRGRYTKAEIRELDAYAITLGIELVPCIQFLGHLATFLRWAASGKYRDTANVMNVASEHTYDLIDRMLRTVTECFSSKRIHMGMDETHDLGRGSYMDAHGYGEFSKLFSDHLEKVTKMAQSYGLKPMIWSDMIIKCCGGRGVYDTKVEVKPEHRALVPEGCELVFWDYYNAAESFYAINIENHKKLNDNTIFAGGIWTWSGHCPHFSRSIRHTLPALEACRKGQVGEIFATIWHNGAEASMLTSIAGLAWYADYDYKGEWNEETIRTTFANATGECYDEFLMLELPELPHGGPVAISRSLLYNDPLLGLIDANIADYGAEKFAPYYKKTTAKLKAIKPKDPTFAPCFKTITALSDLLENKASFGVRLKDAYDAEDKDALSALSKECTTIIRKLKKLRAEHKLNWMTYNKAFGWEALEIRYGGLIARFETAKERLDAYLAGEIDKIEELTEERLRIDAKPRGYEPFHNPFLWMGYSGTATAARI